MMSHNHMAAFFSGTDVSTLVKEGSDLNHFLSLIVCNAGQYVARITRKLKKKIKAEALITLTESTEYKTFEDATVTLSKGTPHQTTKVEEKEETVIEYFEMRINKTEVPEPFKELDERLDAIKKSKLNAKYTFSTPTYQSVNAHYNIPYREPNPKYEFATHQTSLPFEGYEEIEEGFNTPSIPDEEDKDIEFYQYEKVPFTIVKTLCTQLLTSSIIVSSDTNINLDNWVKKMDSIYEARFGDLKDSYTQCRLKNWIQTHTEAILCYTVDKNYEDTLAARYKMGHDYDYNDSDAFIHLYASDMITYLDSLPKSIVKDMMIEELINLMPKEYENFRDNC